MAEGVERRGGFVGDGDVRGARADDRDARAGARQRAEAEHAGSLEVDGVGKAAASAAPSAAGTRVASAKPARS